jgi:hypothetical protein
MLEAIPLMFDDPARSLQKRVHDGTANKFESSFFQIGTDGIRLGRRGAEAHFWSRGVEDGLARGEKGGKVAV